MAPYFCVRSCFINVGSGAGDAAIHAIIQKKSDDDVGTVVKLILVDGGPPNSGDLILDFMYRFEREYGNTTIPFDAIVITHWDDDHYAGVSELISKDLNASGQCNHMRYSGKNPLTTMYCPGTPTKTLNLLFSMNVNGAKGTVSVKSTGGGTSTVCKLVSGVDAIGFDLFSGTTFPPKTDRTTMTLDAFYSKHPALAKDKGGMPAFLVVGIENIFAGPTQKAPQIIPRGDKELDREGPAKTNAWSLMALLVWPGFEANGKNRRRVSLYSGGDAEQVQEDRLLTWIKKGAQNNVDEISTVKAGHHGAKYGTTSMWSSFAVGRFIFSAGDDTTYNHPAWQTVAYLCAKYKSADNKIPDGTPDDDTTPLLSMTTPIWMRAFVTDAALEGGFFSDKKLWPPYSTILKDLFPSSTKWFESCEALPVGDDEDEDGMDVSDTQQSLKEYLEDYWAELASPAETDDGLKAKFIHGCGYIDLVSYPPSIELDAEWSFEPPAKKMKSRDNKAKKVKDSQGGNWTPETDGDPRAFKSKAKASRPPKSVSQKKQDSAARAKQIAQRRKGVNSAIIVRGLKVPRPRLQDDSQPLSLVEWMLDYYTTGMAQFLSEHKDGGWKFTDDLTTGAVVLPATGWLCKSMSARSLLVDGSTDAKTGVVTIDKMLLSIGPDSGAWGLSFSTTQDAFVSQFAKQAANPSPDGKLTAMGTSDFIPGQIFSLDTTDPRVKLTRGPPTFADLWDYLGCSGFPGWARTLLGGLPLSLDTAAMMPRNFILFQPQTSANYTALRLQSVVAKKDNTIIADLVHEFLGQDARIDDILVVGNRCANYTVGAVDWNLSIASSIYVRVGIGWAPRSGQEQVTLALILGLHDSGFDLMLQLDGLDVFDVLSWIGKTGQPTGEIIPSSLLTDIQKAVRHIADPKNIYARQLALTIGNDADGKRQLQSFRLDMELSLSFGAPTNHAVAVAASFSWSGGVFQFLGSLWDENIKGVTSESPGTIPQALSPFREDFLELTASTPGAIDYIDLKNLKQGQTTLPNIPEWVPTELAEVSIRIAYGDGGCTLGFSGTLQAKPPDTDPTTSSGVPPLWLDRISLSASCVFGGTNGPALDLLLRADVELFGRDLAGVSPATISARIEHSSETGEWTFGAEAVSLTFAHLYSLFESGGQQEAVMNFMEKIEVPYFAISYGFAKSRPAALDVTAQLTLGPIERQIELGLKYHYSGKTDTTSASWTLHAEGKQAAEADKTIQISDLLSNLPAEDLALLPEFITDLGIPLDQLAVTLDVFKPQSDPNKLVFCLDVKLDDFHLSFVQFQDHSKLNPPPTPMPKPTRMLRFALTKLPTFPKMPIIETLEQPFDQMDFLWLSGNLTKGDVDLLNTDVYSGLGEPLMFQKTGAADTDVVGEAGCHFQIIMNQGGQPTVALDYIFGRPVAPANQLFSLEDPPPPPPPPPEGTGDTTSAPVTKSFGSLSIKNIGLSLSPKRLLSITLDATATLGPLGFSLIGFTIALDLKNVKTIHDITNTTVSSVSINGLGLGFHEGPVSIAGVFEHLHTATLSGYAGGIAIAVEPYSFMAAGEYAEKTTPTGSFKTVFVFARLNGPLIELEIAEISGITGGFGYNSDLRFPSVAEITSFPFVSIGVPGTALPASSGGSGGSSSPMDQLNALVDNSGGGKGWITPCEGSIWLAAGLEIKAVQAIAVQAVLAVDLSPTPKIGLIAEATATMPPDVPAAEQLLFVDLGMTAVLEPTLGTLVVDGQLTPRSFVLNPSCKLTGAFALRYWFGASPHAGDWVFSLGGYHPAYRPPEHYPAVSERLGISWQYDQNLSIGGGAYFAITPQMVMAGGRLDAVFNKGDLDASLSAWADFLVKYKPFFFQGEVGVTVQAGYRLGVGKLKHRVGISVGADVQLWGPPIAGVAKVHTWFKDFSIHFGPSATPAPALTMAQLLDLLRQTNRNDSTAQKSLLSDHILSLTAGAVTQQRPANMSLDVAPTASWLVRGPLLAFDITSRFPLTTATSNDGSPASTIPNQPVAWGLPISCKPLGMYNRSDAPPTFTSALTLAVTSNSPAPIGTFVLAPMINAAPAALWEPYTAGSDPLSGGGSVMLSGSAARTVPQIMGVHVSAPRSAASPDGLPAFDIEAFGTRDANDGGVDPVLSPGESQGAFVRFLPGTVGGTEGERMEGIVSWWGRTGVEKAREAVAGAYGERFGGVKLKTGRVRRFEGAVRRGWRGVPAVSMG